MIHDLIIRTIAEYIICDNTTLINLQCINQRFYSIRDMFIKQIVLTIEQSNYVIKHRPYGWNKVYLLILCDDDNNTASELGLVRHLIQLRIKDIINFM